MNEQNIGTDGNIYKYEVWLSILINDASEIINLEPKDIHYLYIDYDYVSSNMPWMMANISLEKKILDKMIQYSTTSVINIKVDRFIKNTDLLGVRTNYIQEQCSYFLANDYNKNNAMDYQDDLTVSNGVIQNIAIGLIKVDHINNNQKNISGILRQSSLMDSVYYCCSGLPLLIEPFKYNPVIDQLILPNLSSVASAISFLNTRYHTFYDTPYRFFMDFKVTYLMSCLSNPIPKKGDTINSIIFNILEQKDISVANLGMITDLKQKAYIIDLVNGSNIHLLEDTSMDKNFNQINAINTYGKMSTQSLNINRNSNIKSKNNSIRISNNNDTLLKNRSIAIEMSSINVTIVKDDIDSSVMTINNKYNLKFNDKNNINRNGDYILTGKKEVYTRDNDYMNLQTTMLFKKAPKSN